MSRIAKEFGAPFTVIATGGLAPLFVGATPVIAHLEPEITMSGLVEIHRSQQEKAPMTDRPRADELLFLPLGGCGEIGMNLNLYGHAGKWLMVDLGITFGNEIDAGHRRHHAGPDLHRGASRRSRSASC